MPEEGTEHTVGDGESIISIAKQHGFFWKTIWDHGRNAKLKSLRTNPNVLLAGDIVFVPKMQEKFKPGATEKKHKFKRKGEPVKLKLQLMLLGEPRANEDYVLDIEGTLIKGTTDGAGKLEQFIPGTARSGSISLRGGEEVYPLRIGDLDPVDTLNGLRQRLNNSGFDCGSNTSDELDDMTREALRQYQTRNNLEVTGEPDAATKAKLMERSQ
jgi:N-acetylmuramoyl-L-alanine amidase